MVFCCCSFIYYEVSYGKISIYYFALSIFLSRLLVTGLAFLMTFQEVHDYLKIICPDLHIIRGEYDEETRYPETKTLTIGQFKLGLCHGHQVWLCVNNLLFISIVFGFHQISYLGNDFQCLVFEGYSVGGPRLTSHVTEAAGCRHTCDWSHSSVYCL